MSAIATVAFATLFARAAGANTSRATTATKAPVKRAAQPGHPASACRIQHEGRGQPARRRRSGTGAGTGRTRRRWPRRPPRPRRRAARQPRPAAAPAPPPAPPAPAPAPPQTSIERLAWGRIADGCPPGRASGHRHQRRSPGRRHGGRTGVHRPGHLRIAAGQRSGRAGPRVPDPVRRTAGHRPGLLQVPAGFRALRAERGRRPRRCRSARCSPRRSGRPWRPPR